ncbi:MAG: hypothetical protein RMK91_03255 [Pseudanabaenaceae cyanobacterium SKYGB_i_bin29]|nr:hypothetical protein [Pseudanabaenaceae cyanobacterium SKYG29]MDW8420861.1 hypothetical protein [Pseudanabaenaceae cyanobacterium SKYGB_i_bin29]
MANDKILEGITSLLESVATIKTDLAGVKAELTEVKQDLAGVKAELTEVKQDLAGVKAELTEVKQDLAGVKAELTEVKQDLAGVKAELTEVKQDFATFKVEVNTRLDHLDREVATLRQDFRELRISMDAYQKATDRVNGLVTTIVAGASAVVILSPLSRLVVRSLGLD